MATSGVKRTPCEECGGIVIWATENVLNGRIHDNSDVVATDFCTNAECPSNTALTGFHRIGPNSYTCLACQRDIATPIEFVISHRRSHQRVIN